MENFLHSVAADLWQRYGTELSELRVLLPNNRSRLFLVDELSAVAGRPLWAPAYTSVDMLMEQLSGVARIDRIRAITELYKVYSQYHAESFDSFFRWGEVLLNDFDAVDKYMIDADMLFANISDLKDLESDISYLTPEQAEIIRRFWGSFGWGDQMSDYKQHFLTIWRTLAPIYHTFRDNIARVGLAYTGQMYRLAAEKIKTGGAPQVTERYAVIGFNALSEAEKVLFDYLARDGKTDFYWDYDEYYLADEKQEAGLFIRDNLRRYPQPIGFQTKSNFAAPKKITVISTASDSLQCKYAADFITDIASSGGSIDKRTAIVLTDENLLSPLLYSLPDSVGKVNITMGYPLRNTLAYSFTERLLLLQQRARRQKNGNVSFYHADVIGILSHPYIIDSQSVVLKKRLVENGRIYVASELLKGVSPVLDKIFVVEESWRTMSDYICGVISDVVERNTACGSADERALRSESFGLIADGVMRTANSLSECNLDMELQTFTSLLRRMLQTIRIPYSGEPLRGVQIMGILETRNLDFDNVLILSMNDANFPSGRINDISFIPFNLRLAYGLPTPRHSEGVYAYYFYRLLQRAARVDMTYCSVGDDKSSGEQSRYIYQLDYESPHTLRRIEKSLNVNLSPHTDISVAKSGPVSAALEDYLDGRGRRISPSALNNYMECPLKFYFKFIANIKIEDEIDEEIDNSLFGTILHKAMQLLYADLRRCPEPQTAIAAKIGTDEVHAAVVCAITEDYFGGEQVAETDYAGSLMMVRDTVCKYINDSVLPFDAARSGYRILELEYEVECDFAFNGHTVRLGGKIDRMDKWTASDEIRIIDYKTGRLHNDFNGVAGLLSDETERHNGAALQTFIYSMIVQRNQLSGKIEGTSVSPSLYYVRHLNNTEYSPLLNDKTQGEVAHYADYADEFEEKLADVLQELFDNSVPFVQTQRPENCQYCDFAKICRRN